MRLTNVFNNLINIIIMKKLIVLFSILCIVGLSMNAAGQNPATRSTNTSNSKPAAAATAGAADRQIKKGDAQLSKANNSYQRAQSVSSSSSSKPTSSVNRTSTTSSNRPAAGSTSSNRVSSGNTTSNRPTSTTTVVNTNTSPNVSTSAKPTSNTTTSKVNRASTASTSSTARPTSNATTSARPATTTNSVAGTAGNNARTSATVSATAVDKSANVNTVSNTELKRGYNDDGVASPQPAPTGGRGNATPNDPGKGFGPAPFMHPNHHNFGGHMNIPPRIQPVFYGGVPYYFYNSVFCRMMNGYYVICRPPLGAVIAYSIFNTWHPVIVVHKNVRYYYDDGTFYLPRNRDYVVVAPPVGALVAELPCNYETIVLEGRVYYKVDNVYYKEVIVNGYFWYEVLFVA